MGTLPCRLSAQIRSSVVRAKIIRVKMSIKSCGVRLPGSDPDAFLDSFALVEVPPDRWPALGLVCAIASPRDGLKIGSDKCREIKIGAAWAPPLLALRRFANLPNLKPERAPAEEIPTNPRCPFIHPVLSRFPQLYMPTSNARKSGALAPFGAWSGGLEELWERELGGLQTLRISLNRLDFTAVSSRTNQRA